MMHHGHKALHNRTAGQPAHKKTQPQLHAAHTAVNFNSPVDQTTDLKTFTVQGISKALFPGCVKPGEKFAFY